MLYRFLTASFLFLFLFTHTVNAQSGGGRNTQGSGGGQNTQGGETGLQNPLNVDSLTCFLAEILHIVALIALPFIVLAIVYTGFLFVMAQGNETKLQKAKTAFMWTVIGALVILGAEVLAQAIGGTVSQLGGSDVNLSCDV